MARKPTPREYMLMAILVGSVLIVLYSFDGGIGIGGGGAQKKESGSLGELPRVFLDKVYAEAEAYDASGRDLFKYGPPPRTGRPPKPKPAKPKPKRVETRKPVVRPPRKQPAGPVAAKPPEVRFRYLGYLGPKNDKIAVFEEGEDMMLARSGEIVQKQFKVLEFKYESILMGYVDPRFKSKTTEVTQEQ